MKGGVMQEVKPERIITHIVGIDPDLKKTGIAIWDVQQKKFIYWCAVPFIEIAPIIKQFCDEATAEIILEAPWLNKKANFRKGSFSKRVSDSISKKVGQNHAVAKMISEVLQGIGWSVIEKKPLVKGLFKKKGCWTVIGRKFIEMNSGVQSRINDEIRDAMYLIIISNSRSGVKDLISVI